jgi:DNA mismatch repair protein MSH4
MDLARMELHLASFADTSTYARTLAKLHSHAPDEVLFPATAYSGTQVSKLYQLLSANLDDETAFITLSRKHFSEARGMEELQALCVPEFATVLMDVQSRYNAFVLLEC